VGLSDQDYKLAPSDGKSEILSILPTYSVKNVFERQQNVNIWLTKLQINM